MVVSLHHGEVFAESLEGVGSRFIVHLPILA
jgi:signal transduction histidine kinase